MAGLARTPARKVFSAQFIDGLESESCIALKPLFKRGNGLFCGFNFLPHAKGIAPIAGTGNANGIGRYFPAFDALALNADGVHLGDSFQNGSTLFFDRDRFEDRLDAHIQGFAFNLIPVADVIL